MIEERQSYGLRANGVHLMIQAFYDEVCFYAKQRYKCNYKNQMVEDKYWSARSAMRTVMIYGTVWDYFENDGTAD